MLKTSQNRTLRDSGLRGVTAAALFTLTLFRRGKIINTLAAEVLIGNSTGLCWLEGTTIQQGYSAR